MSYSDPDLTGSLDDYKVVNHAFRFIKQDQVLEFNDTVFADSISISIVGSSTVPLQLGLDYVINDSDIDYNALSYIKLLDNSFSKTLVKSVTITKTFSVELTFNTSYQKLYPVASLEYITKSNKYRNLTPDLLDDLITTQQRHEYLLATISGVTSVGEINPSLLEEDIHKEYIQNFITTQTYEIDVPSGLTFIRPIGGAYFKDSLKVYKQEYEGFDRELTIDVDYIPYGLDIKKTSMTSNTSGVYKYISFISDVKGTIRLEYHAFGGDPTLQDLKDIDESINNVVDYITNSQLLTEDTLSSSTTITNIENQLIYLESEMRKLATDGNPSYGDVSSGNSLLKRITAPDTGLHWWTIAELYKVNGSDSVFTSGMMRLNISTLNTNFTFSTVINCNLSNTYNKFHVAVDSSMYPIGYVPFIDYSDLDNIIRPQFRIIWNESTSESSGIYLQIGMELKTVVEESIVVEDVSGAECCWKLITEVDNSVGPEDDVIALPSGNSTWSTLNSDSRQENYLIPLLDGNLIWAGSESLNRPTGGLRSVVIEHFLDDSVDISRIRKIRYDLEEDGGNRFPILIDVLPGSDSLLGTSTFTYNGQNAYFNGKIYRDTYGEIVVEVVVDVTAGAASNELSLKHVVIYT